MFSSLDGWSPLLDDLCADPDFQAAAQDDFTQLAKDVERQYIFDAALRAATSQSILTQVAIHEHGGHIHVTPYHASSLHSVVNRREESVLLRPARVNRRYWATFAPALRELERLLDDPTVTEREIEALLVSNPLLLKGLGYREVYHQVVLPRENAPDLRPDIIAEPAASNWAEIVELKLPRERILVGRGDRARLSAGLAEAVAQLREYAAYFDDRSAASAVEERLGLPCYRPRLAVIVGRDPTRFSPEEQRRALTAHPDLRVVTYDDLIRAARRRLLL